MKVAIIGAKKFDSIEYHIHEQLSYEGHDVVIFDYKKVLPNKIDYGLSQLSNKYVENKNNALLNDVLNFKPDLVIGIYRHIHPNIVKTIKNEGVKIIHINPDALTTFQNQQLFVEPYDAYFTKDPYIVNFMKNKLSLNAFLYQEAFNPRLHKQPDLDLVTLEKEVNIDVLCFGTMYPYRNGMLRFLKDEGIDIKLFGVKAKYFDPYLAENYQNRGIYGEEKAKILNGAKIVFNNFHYAEVESVNNKFFEINGAGAFQICDYKPILNNLLPIDPKKVSFNTIEEASKLIKFYTNEEEARHEIRQTIHKHFLENYTYEAMLKDVFNKI